MNGDQKPATDESLHASILKSAMDGFWMVDLEGRLLEVNDAYCRMSGYSRPELLALRINELDAVETSTETAKRIQDIISRGESRFRSRHRRKDGSLFDVEVSAQKPGSAGRMVAFLRDISAAVQAQNDYQQLFQEMTVGFALHEIICDASGRPVDYRFLAANPAFERLTGLKARDILGKTAKEIIPGIEPYWIELYGGVALTGRPANFEQFSAALGRHFQGAAFRPAPGRFVVTFSDVTAAKTAEAACRDSEAMFRTMFDINSDAAFVHAIAADGTPGPFLLVNEVACSRYGYSREELLRMTPADIDANGMDDARRLALQTMARTGQCMFEVTHACKDKRSIPVEISSRVFTNKGNRQVISLARDITKRKQAEAKENEISALLHDEQAMLARTENIAHVGSWEWDVVTDKVTWSQELFRLFQLDPRQGAPDFAAQSTLYHPEDFARLGQAVKTTVADGTPYELELRTAPKDSGMKVCVARGLAEKAPDGKIFRLFGSLQDITERKQAETSLANLQKLQSLGTLAGGIAHDFNNILTAILGNLSLLQSEVKKDSEALGMIKEAQDACATAKNLSHQLLTFAKGGNPIIKGMDLRPLLKQATGFALRGSNVRCAFDIGEHPLAVKADEGQITQVIQNLAINATQAMADGGDITVRAAVVSLGEGEHPPLAAGRYVQVKVEGQGIGMRPEHLSKIFDPYFSTKAKGRGLGLAMCRSIMVKHGGAISAESKPGAGATFTLFFPVADVADIPAEQEPAALTTGSGRVLIMEDEAPISKILKRMLERLGYQAEAVEDGQAALDAYKKAMAAKKPYAAVIMDLTIPGGMGGKDAIVRLKAIDPKVKAIVSSGYSEDLILSEYAAHGFSGTLAKPYRINDVSEALRLVIGSKTG